MMLSLEILQGPDQQRAVAKHHQQCCDLVSKRSNNVSYESEGACTIFGAVNIYVLHFISLVEGFSAFRLGYGVDEALTLTLTNHDHIDTLAEETTKFYAQLSIKSHIHSFIAHPES